MPFSGPCLRENSAILQSWRRKPYRSSLGVVEPHRHRRHGPQLRRLRDRKPARPLRPVPRRHRPLRSYNRTLTPYGFQAEERTYRQAPEVYFKMSPFSYADKIKTPILLMHGEADDNQGTFPSKAELL